MRAELLYNPRLLLERLASASLGRRRLAKLRGTVASHLLTGHIDSLELLALLRPNPPKVIYDIGANVGTWTLLVRALFPDAHIHAFEPLQKHAVEFSRSVRDLTQVTLHNIALGPRAEETIMKVRRFSDASSLLDVVDCERDELVAESTERVTVFPIDAYAEARKLPLPDLIKLDVQGYELEVLKGATNCLQHAQAVIIEVSFKELYKGQCLFHDVVEFCACHKFFLSAAGQGTAIGQRLVQTDVLFEKQRNTL